MGLFDFLFGRPKRRRRRRTTRPTAARQQRQKLEAQQRERRALDREAQRWIAADNRRRRQQRERAARKAVRDRELAARREARMISRTETARARAIAAYMQHGATRAEAEQLYDREPDWATYDYNPRGVRRRSWPRRRTNPVHPVVAEIAKDVLKGGLIAAAQEEFKEWRTQMHRPPGGPQAVVRAHRRNPARLEPNHADPKLREMSERFHGRPDQILHLDDDQRRPPPKHVVLIGQERATVYRTPRSSERSGADWEHESGDRGVARRNASGRRLLVADERGNVYLLQGSSRMRFDPDAGLVG